MVLNCSVFPSLGDWSRYRIGTLQQPCQIYTIVKTINAMPHLTVEAEMPATSGSLSLHKSGIILTHKNINKNEKKKSFQQSMLLNKSTKWNTTPIFMPNPERFPGSPLCELKSQFWLWLCSCLFCRKMPLAEDDFTVIPKPKQTGKHKAVCVNV